MEPIVSPWFIYFIGIVENISVCLGVISFVMLLLFVGHIMFTSVEYPCDEIKPKWWVIVCAGILMFISCFIPDKKTVIGMAVAQNVTKDRVVATGQMIVKGHDAIKKDVLDLILAIKSKSEEQSK